jgi:hypothetical protein
MIQPAIFAAAMLALFTPASQALMIGDTVIVKDTGVSPSRTVKIGVDGFYTGNTYAGVIKLVVGGVAMDGFCIDPWHFSSPNPLTYKAVPITQAPKSPGTMNAGQAQLIGALLALAYSPAMGADAAAALQLAIWEVVGGDDFTLLSANDYGAAALLASAKTYSGPLPNLIGLTGPGQDYVVQVPPKVPDGGFTVLLLGVSLVGIAFVRSRLASAS